MAKSKPRRGRPATGADPVVSMRIPQAVLDDIDMEAELEGTTRSDVIRARLAKKTTRKKGKADYDFG